MKSRTWIWILVAAVAFGVVLAMFSSARQPAPAPKATATSPVTVFASATPLPSPTPILPTAILATATPIVCVDGSQYVKDLSVPDGSAMQPGQQFNKTWRLRNTGTCPWDSSYRLAFVAGNAMGGQPAQIQGIVNPGANYDVTVGMTAPTTPGDSQGWWQMVNGRNVAFGPRIWVDIYVIGPATARPPTPVSPPTPAAKPVIQLFVAQPETVDENGLIVVKWTFAGTGLSSAILTRTDPDGTVVPLMGGGDVPYQGQYEDVAANPGTVVYKLSVTNEVGNASASAAVTVNPAPSAVQLPAGITPTP
ncbi:MAG TPA: NBR1-Ig-like domain-containing protein [Anaerolineales bacterium]|nr:NBR1-Ig-like domain-containing protein [Anaerolineales bacterium]